MQRRNVLALAGVLSLALAAWTPTVAQMVPTHIAAAVANPARPQADKDRDADRKPAEMLTFAHVKPGQRVVDLMPGGGYFTRLFSLAVGPRGQVYAYDVTEMNAAEKEPLPASGSAFDPAYPNVTVLSGPVNAFATPKPVDMVWTAQNYHDLHDPFMAPADVKIFNAAVFKALKPGGLFIVLDHAADDGSGLRDTDTLHRIDAAKVKAEVTAAGFQFVGESKVLRNPADTHTLKVFDKSIRGHTDQFVYKFRKPG